MPEADAVTVAEERRPCPVCLGVKLTKRNAAPAGELVLDRCERCGGIWFDAGEVMKLRNAQSPEAWRKVSLSAEAYKMSCHGCRALIDRNAARCPACGWRNVLGCPMCARPMERREVRGHHLDFCDLRHGVWFDRIELAEIWNLEVEAAAKRRSPVAWEAAGDAAYVGAEAMEFLLWNPDLAEAGARAVAGGARAVAMAASELAVDAPQILSGVVEATGDLAGGVFEAIFEIIGAILD